jgi:hypothetical protein
LDAAIHVVAHRHPEAAASADDETLKQRWTFSGRAPATIAAERLGALAQTTEVVLVLVPSDVAFVGVRDQDLPVLLGSLLAAHASSGRRSSPGSTEHEGARIARVVKDA